MRPSDDFARIPFGVWVELRLIGVSKLEIGWRKATLNMVLGNMSHLFADCGLVVELQIRLAAKI